MTVAFELNGQSFTALNGGPNFKFSEAVSFQIECATQAEVDYYWEKLSADGDPNAQVCGWLKDKFGLSWQVVPKILPELLSDPDTAKSARAMNAMLKMKKVEVIRDGAATNAAGFGFVKSKEGLVHGQSNRLQIGNQFFAD